MQGPQAEIEKLKNKLSGFQTWEDKYKQLIQWGKSLPRAEEGLYVDENLVPGCQSQVWLTARLSEEGLVIFVADSDALLVKGLVAMLVQVFSGSSPEQILGTSADFLKDLGFSQNLTPSRSNGLFSMLKKMKHYAIAFDYKLKSKL